MGGTGQNRLYGLLRFFYPNLMAKARAHKKGWHQSPGQKAKARETMLANRKKHPDKFRAAKNPKPEPPAPKIETPPTAPSPAFQPTPPPPVITPAQRDTIIFGNEIPPPPKIESTAPSQPLPQPPPGTPGAGSGPDQPQSPEPATANSVRKYAMMVWSMITKTFCGIFGEGFQPMVIKSQTGEVLYDENTEGINVWTNYLVSIGIRAFSPLVELWAFMAVYVSLRFPLIVAKFKRKKSTPSGQPVPAPETVPSSAPAPAPETTEPTPATPAPAPEIEPTATEAADNFV